MPDRSRSCAATGARTVQRWTGTAVHRLVTAASSPLPPLRPLSQRQPRATAQPGCSVVHWAAACWPNSMIMVGSDLGPPEIILMHTLCATPRRRRVERALPDQFRACTWFARSTAACRRRHVKCPGAHGRYQSSVHCHLAFARPPVTLGDGPMGVPCRHPLLTSRYISDQFSADQSALPTSTGPLLSSAWPLFTLARFACAPISVRSRPISCAA